MNTPKYATSGYTGATALNESTFGTGQQQRADVSGFQTFKFQPY